MDQGQIIIRDQEKEGEIAMIVRLRQSDPDFPDLTAGQPYFVIGLEADDYRILNDHGMP